MIERTVPPARIIDGSGLAEAAGGDLPKILDAVVLEPDQLLVLVVPEGTTMEEMEQVAEVIERTEFRQRVLLVSEAIAIGKIER